MPPLARTSLADTTRCGHRAGGTHPTGMHSCLTINFSNVFCSYVLGLSSLVITEVSEQRIDRELNMFLTS